MKLLILLVFTLLVFGCGGGGSSETNSPSSDTGIELVNSSDSSFIVSPDESSPYFASVRYDNGDSLTFAGNKETNALEWIEITDGSDGSVSESVVFLEGEVISEYVGPDGERLEFDFNLDGAGVVRFRDADSGEVIEIAFDSSGLFDETVVTGASAITFSSAPVLVEYSGTRILLDVVDEYKPAEYIDGAVVSGKVRALTPVVQPEELTIPFRRIGTGKYEGRLPTAYGLETSSVKEACQSTINSIREYCALSNTDEYDFNDIMEDVGCNAVIGVIAARFPNTAKRFPRMRNACIKSFKALEKVCEKVGDISEVVNDEEIDKLVDESCTNLAESDAIQFDFVTDFATLYVSAQKDGYSDSEEIEAVGLDPDPIEVTLKLPVSLDDYTQVSVFGEVKAYSNSIILGSDFPCDQAECTIDEDRETLSENGFIVAVSNADGATGYAELDLECTAAYLSPSDMYVVNIDYDASSEAQHKIVYPYRDSPTTNFTASARANFSGGCTIELNFGGGMYEALDRLGSNQLSGSMSPDARFGSVETSVTMSASNGVMLNSLINLVGRTSSTDAENSFSESYTLTTSGFPVQTGRLRLDFSVKDEIWFSPNCIIPTCDAQPSHTSQATGSIKIEFIRKEN
ncbi:hypothetical protein [Vibrio rotiferianus]|uniref:hypothetical protein n=1 Tax=Vibrio rotiferianus TaxID=190895 RepID=UPI00390AC2F0